MYCSETKKNVLYSLFVIHKHLQNIHYILSKIDPHKFFTSLVLDKTLKGIRGVRLDNRKVLRAPCPRMDQIFQRFFYVVELTKQKKKKKFVIA